MRKIKVFNLNEKGKIEFTKEELEKLLNETYEDGYCEGNSHTYTWTQPYYSSKEITLLNNDMSTTDSTNNLKTSI